jgi:hypothetical protein
MFYSSEGSLQAIGLRIYGDRTRGQREFNSVLVLPLDLLRVWRAFDAAMDTARDVEGGGSGWRGRVDDEWSGS